MNICSRLPALLSVIACCISPQLSAQEIVVGQCAPLSGSLAHTGDAMVQGVRVAIEAANAAGGIHGQKIKLVQKDDGYDSERTVSCTQDMIRKEKAVALIGYAGTGNIAELLRRNVLAEANIPLIAPYTGGSVLRDPFNPYIFHIRAGYDDETRTMVDQFVATGLKRIAVFYQNDAFGQSGVSGVEKALDQHKLKVVVKASYEKNTEDIDAAVNIILKSNPQAVIMIAITRPAALFVKAALDRSPGLQVFSISVVNGEDIYRIAGDEFGRGVGITQVMPSPFSGTVKIVRDYQEAMKQHAPGQPFSYASFEEYVGARILIEGLRKAGPSPSSGAVLKALETVKVDVGGYKVAFGPKQRTGSSFVEVTIIGQNGMHLL
ncbi:MAG: transporter substrate-binding protein [Rhodocyclales bacterium]|nr:transporter substrate-binding protein [Rhodocyclales bacterium]MDB5887173.1 transporter substrate-binding protein [Rhodocyclales bacterium]